MGHPQGLKVPGAAAPIDLTTRPVVEGGHAIDAWAKRAGRQSCCCARESAANETMKINDANAPPINSGGVS